MRSNVKNSLLCLLCLNFVLILNPSVHAYEDYQDESLSVDPWEGFNRRVFSFNDRFDQWLMRPLAKGYVWLLPDFAENAIGRFFENLEQFGATFNALFQRKWGTAGQGFSSFGINSTLGLAGFFDVATDLGFPRINEDFGQTLGFYGLSSGPYLVIPFIGPSNLRDGISLYPDRFLGYTRHVKHVRTKNTLLGLELLDLRASLLGVDQLIQGDRYTFVRDAYLQRRAYLVNDGAVEDDFLDDDW